MMSSCRLSADTSTESARRISVRSWFIVTRPAWVALKNRSFISTASADALYAAATATSRKAEMVRRIMTSTMLMPRRRAAGRLRQVFMARTSA